MIWTEASCAALQDFYSLVRQLVIIVLLHLIVVEHNGTKSNISSLEPSWPPYTVTPTSQHLPQPAAWSRCLVTNARSQLVPIGWYVWRSQLLLVFQHRPERLLLISKSMVGFLSERNHCRLWTRIQSYQDPQRGAQWKTIGSVG